MRASRLLLIILLFIAGFAITKETSGKQKKAYSGNCGYNRGKYYCCYLTGTGAVCYPETPPPPANP
ncbi:MAG: hypothetical protein ABUT20_28420 [Bacteroidota bacterium]